MGERRRLYAMTWDNSLVGRSVLVTGGSRGLGREMGLFLAKAGVKLCFTATKKSEKFVKTLQEVTDILGHNNVFADIVDVCNPEAMERLAFLCKEKFSTIDVLINNAGRGMRLISEKFNTVPTKFWEADPKSWSEIVETNINGPFIATRAVLPYMLKQKFGKIINISTSSQTMVRKGYSPYGPSKSFLEAASSSWAKDLEGTGIDVNVLLPGGATDTDLLPPSKNKKGADGNLLPPSVMNEAIAWLASNKSNGISGGRFIAKYWEDLSARRNDLRGTPQIM